MTRFALLLAACCCVIAPPAMAAETRNVLVLFSNGRLLPANLDVDRGLREILAEPPERNIRMFAEFLDLPSFSGPAYEQTVVTYLRGKYVTLAPEVIVVAGQYALEFILRHRADVFRAVPVVHVAVDKAFLDSVAPLPADVIGVATDYDFAGTITQALRWHPAARRLVVVVGASVRDREWEAKVRADLGRLHVAPTVEILAGMPTDALVEKLRALSEDDVVFTPGYFGDGAGRVFAPRESAKLIAAASKAPVYGPFSTFIGTGVVGGSMPDYAEMGRQGARSVDALLRGAAPATLRAVPSVPAVLQIDWPVARK